MFVFLDLEYSVSNVRNCRRVRCLRFGMFGILDLACLVGN